MINYLILDGEMGGIGLDKSFLTLHLSQTNEKLKIINELSLTMKPNDGIYHVTAEAMSINKINLIDHDKIAITYKQAGTQLYQFLQLAFLNTNEKLIPVGHNMDGDLSQIYDKLMSRNSWETFVSYRRLDTATIAQYLRMIGKLPYELSGSLENLTAHFNINNGELHQARVDVLNTRDVLVKLMEIGKTS